MKAGARTRKSGSAPPKTRQTAIALRYVGEWLLILLALLVVYWPAITGGLLWDDLGHITRPDLQSAHGLWRIWFELGATQQYYPLLHSAFWMEHRLWGDSLVWYHIVNLVEHSLSAFLIVLILRRLDIPGALLAGLIFAVHPVCVESVAWISEQKNTLSGALYLASALVYLDFDASRRRSRYGFALGLFLLSLMSKSVTATLPAALLVVLWWRKGALSWRRDIVPLVPWFAIAAISGAVTAWVERNVIGAKGPDFSLTMMQRLLLAGRALWFYFGKLIWPSDLIFIYPRWVIDPSVARQYAFTAAALLVACGLVVLARRTRGPLAGFLFFAGTLAPALGFVDVYPFLFSYVADHFQYLAGLGVIVPTAAGLTLLAARLQLGRLQATIASGVLIAALSVLSWHQSRLYRDAETLYRDTIARNPDCWMAYLNLGTELAGAPNGLPEAISAFEQAVRLKPDHREARRDLVLAHTMVGSEISSNPSRTAEAVDHLRRAIGVEPASTLAHYTLANILARSHDPAAIGEYEIVLRLDPNHFQAHYNLGTLLLDTPGRQSDAVAHLRAAVKLRPESPEAHVNLAVALSDAPGQRQEAIKEAEAALAANPNLSQARSLLEDLKKH